MPGPGRRAAFTTVITVTGPAKRIVIGAVDPVDEAGALVGPGDLVAQTEQVFKNLDLVLAAVGARLEDIVIWRIFVAAGLPLNVAAGVFFRIWDGRPNPPANTIVFVFVPALAYPGALLTLEAEAVVAA
jgi:enamine deaminase RidA (YjgF/YER057c/UK114 family)